MVNNGNSVLEFVGIVVVMSVYFTDAKYYLRVTKFFLLSLKFSKIFRKKVLGYTVPNYTKNIFY